MSDSKYAQLVELVRELNTVRSIGALLDWDQETYMPKRGAQMRAGQNSLIAGLAHQKLTSGGIGGLLNELDGSDFNGDFVAATNVRETRREYDRAAKLPTALVREIASCSTLAKSAWVDARRESDFARFAPHLERMLELKRQEADAVGWTTEPYDALMDEYEPGAKAAEVERVFDEVKGQLVPLVAAIKNAPRQPDKSIRERHCPRDAQEAFNRTLVEAMGFDLEAGRIDVAAHPFCSEMSSQDVRITTRYDEHYMPMSLFGVMHEAGHGLYEQGLEAKHVGTPMGQSTSLGIHESQSRMWENQVGRGRPFWEHFFPRLQKAFPSMADVSLDDWHFVINTVEPSFIRVEADEVTYGLHIMLRFDLERRMIRDEIAVNDIPEAWNAGIRELLGITPPDDAQGCLQDIHWSMGIFGYFPTYALGNLYAAQFYQAAEKAMPDLNDRISRGELVPLREWLRENIHRHGRRYRAGELVKIVSGRELSPQPFIDYLNGKFKPLYGIG